MTLKGSCLCGDVKFRVEGRVHHTSFCHCVQCRKMSGNYWASLTTPQDGLILESGEASLAWYPNKNHEHAFCVICGSPLFWRMTENEDSVAVSLGAIDGDTGLTIKTHLYTSEKGDYYDLPEEGDFYKEDTHE